MLTAKVEDDDIIRGLELGADDYILKPFTPGILKARVRNLINARVNLKQMYTNLLMTPDVAEGEAESEEKQKCQAARCMDCGVPFCQNGKVISGMVSGCPLNNLVPEWNDLYIMAIWNRHTTDFIRLTTFLNLLQEFVLHFVKKHVHVVFMEMQ